MATSSSHSMVQSASISTQDQPTEGNPRFAGLFRLFRQRPMIAALGIWIIDLLINNSVALWAQAALPNFRPDFVALCIVAAVTAVALGALNWWRVIGFNRPSEWRHLRVLILPAIAMFVFPFAAGANLLDAGTTLYFVVAYLLVAFHEEAIHRGVMLRVLRPMGVGRAVLIGSLLFGAAHLTNVLVRSNPAIVFAQAFGAFTQGIGFSMIRFRTNTLWGLFGLHFVEDLLLHYGNLPVPLVNAAQSTVCLGVGIYLYRQYRREQKAQVA
jgi:membrane protease YdiL (CAAX protease family)